MVQSDKSDDRLPVHQTGPSEIGSYMKRVTPRIGGFSAKNASSLLGYLASISPTHPTEPDHIAKFIQCYGPLPEAVVIPMIVEGREVTTMLDDGATITVTSRRFADLLEASGIAFPYEAHEKVRVFGGGTVNLSQKISLNIGTPTRTAPIEAWICEEVPFDLCIGFDFARSNNFVIDMEDMTVTMFGKSAGEIVPMMNNTQLLSKLSQISQAVHKRDFRLVPDPSTAR